jgi:hypothetical protein
VNAVLLIGAGALLAVIVRVWREERAYDRRARARRDRIQDEIDLYADGIRSIR